MPDAWLRISEITLSAVSLWALDQSNGYDYACSGLAMYFLSNSMGLLAHDESSWVSWYKETEYCSFLCALPLFAAQICLDARVLPNWIIYGITLFIPVQLLILRYILDEEELDSGPLNLTHCSCIFATLYSTLVRNIEHAYIIPYAFAVNHYILFPRSKTLYNFGTSLLCLNWLIYKENTHIIIITNLISAMPGGVCLCISQITLSAVSLLALHESYGYDFACCGLSMFFLSNSLGAIALISGNTSLLAWYKETEYCSFLCALPMFAAQICSDARVMPKWIMYGIAFIIPVELLIFRYVIGTDEMDLRPMNIIHYSCTLAIFYTGYVRNEQAYLIAHTFTVCHHVLLPVSTVWYKFGLTLLCLNWLIYKFNSTSVFIEDFVTVGNQINRLL